MSNCPECNSRKTVHIVYGKKTETIINAEKEGKVKYGGLFVGIDPPDYICKDCCFEFNVNELVHDFTQEELEQYYIKHRSRYIPEKIKYLIINESPPGLFEGITPAFFYNNPNCFYNNNLFMEVMTVLFLPPEFVEKQEQQTIPLILTVKCINTLNGIKKKASLRLIFLIIQEIFLKQGI